MEIDLKELKRRSKYAMGLTSPRFWVVALIYLLMTIGLSDLLSLLPFFSTTQTGFSAPLLFLACFMMLYHMIIDFGYNLWSLWTVRELNPGAGSLVQGFSVVGRVIAMELNILFRLVLWSIGLSFLIIIPLTLGTPSPLVIVLAFLLSYVLLHIMLLRYSLSPYLLADHPDDGAGMAVRRSIELMKGWKWQLFRLEFSFFGWLLLTLLLSTAAFVLALWQGGVFHALGTFPLHQLPDLVAGYSIWSNSMGMDLMHFTAKEIELYTMYAAISSSAWTTLLSDAITLPLLVWLTPYRSVARAGFYDARLRLQQQEADAILPLD